MTTDYFAELYRYDSLMNRRVLEQLRSLDRLDERGRKILSHLLQAQKLWLMRMQGEDYRSLVVWPELSWEECEEVIKRNTLEWDTFIAELEEEELDREITYRTSKGDEFRSSFRQILTHVLLHGSYHRGQLALTVRQSGEEPLLTDYIAWVREQSE